MATPWEVRQPELVVDKVLRRAEVGKIGRKLKVTLALANFKAVRGWEDLPLDAIEPKVDEELRRRRPTSSGDIFSDSSSSTTTSEYRYKHRQLMSSPLKAGPIFSDSIDPRSGSSATSGHRKRTYNSFELQSSTSHSRKRIRSSPISARQPAHLSWKEDYQLPQSSPIKTRKHAGFTTSSGPNVSFYNKLNEEIHSSGFTSPSDGEEDALPTHSFNVRSSPRTPPPGSRSRSFNRRTTNSNKSGGKSSDDANLLIYLANSPSQPSTSRARMQPPSTPPPKNLALPSSMMNTPGGSGTPGMFSGFGGPNTPSQNFDFADFVNITPSPAQNGFSKTPRVMKTPSTITRRRLTFEPLAGSPNIPTSSGRATTGLGVMQLGGDLKPRG